MEQDTPEYIRAESTREINGYVAGLKADGLDIGILWSDVHGSPELPTITLGGHSYSFDSLSNALNWSVGLWIGYHMKA